MKRNTRLLAFLVLSCCWLARSAGAQFPECTILSPQPGEEVHSPVLIRYSGTDPGPMPITTTFEHSTDGGWTWVLSTPAPGSPSANPDGSRPSPFTGAEFLWDAAADGVGLEGLRHVRLRVRATVYRGLFDGDARTLPFVRTLALGDLDGDGDVDAIEYSPDPAVPCAVWPGDGSGGFTTGWTIPSMLWAELGDLDGDGDQDLVARLMGWSNTSTTVWLNDGTGRLFLVGPQYPFGNVTTVLADFDGDGDDDALLIRTGAMPGELWLSDGSGFLVDSGVRLPLEGAAFAADLNGDGDIDVASGSGVYLNSGSGSFVGPLSPFGRSLCAAGDLDGDGDTDLVALTTTPGNGVLVGFVNDGRAGMSAGFVLHSGINWSAPMDAADVDGDGVLDLLMVTRTSEVVQLQGERDIPSQRDTGQRFGDQWDFLGGDLVDLDGDGRRDLVHHGQFPPGRWRRQTGVGPVVVERTVGCQVRSQPTCLGIGVATASAGRDVALVLHADDPAAGALTAVIEWSSDGGRSWQRATPSAGSPTWNPDFARQAPYAGVSFVWDTVADGVGLAAAQPIELRTRLIRGLPQPGRFAAGSTAMPEVSLAFFLEVTLLVDVNQDGDIDIVGVGVSSGNTFVRTWLGDGSGSFADTGQVLPGATVSSLSSVVHGDIDGDGDIDLIGNDLAIWLGDGTGMFARSAVPVAPVPLSAGEPIAPLADLDSDGDLDLVAGNVPKVWLNDGLGGFTRLVQTLVLHPSISNLDLRDLDGDGTADLIALAQWPGLVRMWRNDGTGRFTYLQEFFSNDYGWGFGDLGDLDADGDLDVVSGGYLQVFINDGSPAFFVTQTIGYGDFVRPRLADLDGDGDLDTVRSSAGELLLNDGAGYFQATAAGPDIWGNGSTGGLPCDLDSDGDIDLMFGDELRPEIYWNEGQRTSCGAALVVENHRPLCQLVATAGGGAPGELGFELTVDSLRTGPASALLEHSTDGGASWAACTAAASSPAPNPAPLPPSFVVSWVWDSFADVGASAGPVLVRATVDDGSPATGSCTTGVVTAGCPGGCGDCDGDLAAATVLDALQAAQIAVGLRVASPLQNACCDVDGSGAVDVLDALAMAQRAVGLPVGLVCR